MMLRQTKNVMALALLVVTTPVVLAAQPAHGAKHAEREASSQSSQSARTFKTPEEAGQALAEAVRAESVHELLRVVGPSSRPWLFSGDPVADREAWKQFLTAYDARHEITESESGDGRRVLLVGDDRWPFPAPLKAAGQGWVFDAAAGREEVLNRRIGRNELATLNTIQEIVAAQREYAMHDLDANGYHDYARKIRSSEGKKDGLYWPSAAGEPASPLGELLAQAEQEGYGKAQGNAGTYHGYRYRLLSAQGAHASGGAYDYLVDGRLIGGFAIVAYPAKYGVSGVMSFIVNHEGVVYEKNLGPGTAREAAALRSFDPDASWKRH